MTSEQKRTNPLELQTVLGKPLALEALAKAAKESVLSEDYSRLIEIAIYGLALATTEPAKPGAESLEHAVVLLREGLHLKPNAGGQIKTRIWEALRLLSQLKPDSDTQDKAA